MRSTVIVDASFCPETGAAGWASWVRVDGVSEAIKYAGRFKSRPENSTAAELQAAINGIWIAARHGASVVLVQSDCMAVIHAIRKETKGWVGPLWETALVENGLTSVSLTAKHVKGHTHNKDVRSWCNRWCDENAGLHMRKDRAWLRKQR